MKYILFVLVLGSFLGVSCDSSVGRKIADRQLRNTIVGDWERIPIEERIGDDRPPPPHRWIPDGMTLTKDSLDWYLGFFNEEIDSLSGKVVHGYLGNKLPYKTVRDSVFVRNPLTGNRLFVGKFLALENDTLSLTTDGTRILKYRRRAAFVVATAAFDQVIYSSSGCYGSCPIIDISIDSTAAVLFQGQGYVVPLGRYGSTLDARLKNYLFDKFIRAKPEALADSYQVNHTDDQSITTTFVKGGKIVKTIHDYGKAAPVELVWAYASIAHIYRTTPLTRLAEADEPFYPKHDTFTFVGSAFLLPLQKSESFFLWTELRKAAKTNATFEPKYSLQFTPNYTYWGPDPKEERAVLSRIKSIATDGQRFAFNFEGGASITYDLGYDFIRRNFEGINYYTID
ncbi:DUF6438 domain-containing protein [Flavobacterium sp. JP2137]|uniref:DUF6438 domain-containing protein n=1 Tax=Flavobacterium sp. JP2137 TaxID=3414510 RepID=UPI003D2FEC0C